MRNRNYGIGMRQFYLFYAEPKIVHQLGGQTKTPEIIHQVVGQLNSTEIFQQGAGIFSKHSDHAKIRWGHHVLIIIKQHLLMKHFSIYHPHQNLHS